MRDKTASDRKTCQFSHMVCFGLHLFMKCKHFLILFGNLLHFTEALYCFKGLLLGVGITNCHLSTH